MVLLGYQFLQGLVSCGSDCPVDPGDQVEQGKDDLRPSFDEPLGHDGLHFVLLDHFGNVEHVVAELSLLQELDDTADQLSPQFDLQVDIFYVKAVLFIIEVDVLVNRMVRRGWGRDWLGSPSARSLPYLGCRLGYWVCYGLHLSLIHLQDDVDVGSELLLVDDNDAVGDIDNLGQTLLEVEHFLPVFIGLLSD